MTRFWNLTVIMHAQNRKIGKSKDFKLFWSNKNKYPLQSVVIHNVLVCNASGHGVLARMSQTKDYTTGICCFFAQHTSLKSVGATCLPVGWYFNELTLWQYNWAFWSCMKRTILVSHPSVVCSCHDLATTLPTISHSLTHSI